jgi:hypothetical protein
VSILGALSLPTGDAARIEPLELRAAEQAPQVKPASDGVLDLFKEKRVVALGDFHGVAE